jgi:eukaryotic-like serine/threonine-protein kinase
MILPGAVLAGKYRVERILGQGNMGVVVAATNLALGQLIALKFLLPGCNVGQEQRGRFMREGRAAARLKSQHVARVLDVGTLDDGAPYIVIEYLEGRDLKAILEGRGPLPVGDAVEYVLQACEALAEAHAAGIVHRDIKPANLFLTTDASRMPCVKIFDFGISKLDGELTLTRDAQLMGSPLYMSPEQLGSAHDVDGRADLWSLGATLYELLAGKTPFHADTIEQLSYRLYTGQATPLSAYRPDVPPGLEAVIAQCLQKDRNLRFTNVAELAAALAPWAPARAAAYVERVARVLDVHTEPARSTDLLPGPSPEASAAAAVGEASRRPTDSGPIGSMRGTALTLSHTQSGRLASLPGGTAPRRARALGIVAAVLLGASGLVGSWVALRGRNAPERAPEASPAAAGAAPAGDTAPSVQAPPADAAPSSSAPVTPVPAAAPAKPATARPAPRATQVPRTKPSPPAPQPSSPTPTPRTIE